MSEKMRTYPHDHPARHGGKRRRHLRPFLAFMLRYALIWIVVVFLLLEVFWIYMGSYEKSQDTYEVGRYIDAIDETWVDAHSADLLQSLDPEWYPGDTGKQDLYRLLLDDVQYSKKVTESTSDSSVFELRADDVPFGKLTYEKSSKKGLFGKDRYVLSSEDIDLKKLKTEASVTVPDSWSVSFNGQTLSENFISDASVHLDLLDGFYGKSDNDPYGLPLLQTWTISGVLPGSKLTCMDEDGKEQDPDDLDETSLLVKADETVRKDVTSFIDTFLPLYIQCLSNSNHDALANYRAFNKVVLDGSELDQRVYNAIEGQTWAASQGDTIQDTKINEVYDINSRYVLADITYTLETIGNQGAVQSTSNARVMIYRTRDDRYLAADIVSY